MADVVTTTTPIFAELIKKHNKNVYVFPNALTPEDERFKVKDTKSDRLRFGMIMRFFSLKRFGINERYDCSTFKRSN